MFAVASTATLGCDGTDGDGGKPQAESVPEFQGKPALADAIDRSAMPDDWEVVQLADGRFDVALPRTHRRNHTQVGVARLPMEMLDAGSDDGAVLMVTHGLLPQDGRPPAARLDDVVGGYIDQNPGTLRDRRRGTHAGRPAVEFSQVWEGGTLRGRAIIDDARVFVLIAREPEGGPTASGDRFFARARMQPHGHPSSTSP